MNVMLPPPAGPGGPPPPIAPAGVPAPQHVQGIPGPPINFAELYNHPAANAHAGVYGPVLALFVTEAAVRRTPTEIRVALDVVGDGFLQAYLFLGADDQALAIHTVSRFPTLPGVVTPWDGMCFGFVGDVMGPMAQPVKFPGTTTFDLVPVAVQVPTLATMEAQWLAAGPIPFLPPFGPTDTNTKLVRTRHAALLPFMAVPQCLTSMSMHQLWTALG